VFNSLEALIADNDLITADGYLAHCKNCSTCYYHPSSLIFRSDYWRGRFTRSLLELEIPEDKRTLILGHSDKRIKPHVALVAQYRGFTNTWSINSSSFGNFLRALPLGLTNPTNETEMHQILGNTDILLEAVDYASNSSGYDRLFYSNFSIDTNLSSRLKLLAVLDRNKIVHRTPTFTRNGRLNFLKDIRNSAFTLCPEGNGVDTHRIWETLYLGRVPIITKSKAMKQIVKDLPVIAIDDWEQISDKQYFKDKWVEMQKQVYDFRKLQISFWINKFCANI